MKVSKSPKLETTPIKLNIGCGISRANERNEPLDGYTHVDISKGCNPDIVLDVNKYPWPFKDNSVSEIYCSHFLEHLDGIERMAFFNECYRIMKNPYEEDGVMIYSSIKAITPAPFTHRYMQDPTHKFPMVVQEFYNYLHKPSRIAMGLEHYPLTCNFEWSGFFQDNPEIMTGRNDEFRNFHAKYSINSLLDLIVTLKKI